MQTDIFLSSARQERVPVRAGGGGGGDRIQLYQELHLHFFLPHKNEPANLSMHWWEWLITPVFNGLHGIGRAWINSEKHAFQHAIKNAWALIQAKCTS